MKNRHGVRLKVCEEKVLSDLEKAVNTFVESDEVYTVITMRVYPVYESLGEHKGVGVWACYIIYKERYEE